MVHDIHADDAAKTASQVISETDADEVVYADDTLLTIRNAPAMNRL